MSVTINLPFLSPSLTLAFVTPSDTLNYTVNYSATFSSSPNNFLSPSSALNSSYISPNSPALITTSFGSINVFDKSIGLIEAVKSDSPFPYKKIGHCKFLPFTSIYLSVYGSFLPGVELY